MADQTRCHRLTLRRCMAFFAASLAWACVGSAPAGPSVGLADALSNKAETGNTFGSDLAKASDSAATPDVPKVGTQDAKTDGIGGEVKGCSCSGIECGHPPDCPQMECGPCPKGALCNGNTCEADPNCTCGTTDCGVLPGCQKDCGACEAPKTCNPQNNTCELDCSCAIVECGQLPGCSNSCGKCETGKVCEDFICKPDPKCACKAGMCGVPPGCAANCGTCAASEKCVDNKCTAGGDSCPCNGIACGFAKPACAKSCGSCQINQICSGNQCKGVSATGKNKMGEPCGPSEDCPVPPAGAGYFQQKQFIECQHNQCEGGLCIGNVCTKKCTIGKDEVDNNTGAAGPDGIEDPGQPSTCGGAMAGPLGSNFKCVEQNSPAQVLAGQTDQQCLPGATFAPCGSDADCPAGELCRIYPMQASYQARCGPKMANPIGSAGVKPTQACNINPVAGPVAVCETGWCKSNLCLKVCKADADCKALPGQCAAGQCITSGATCTKDADCPAWACKDNVTFVESNLAKFKACQPVLTP